MDAGKVKALNSHADDKPASLFSAAGGLVRSDEDVCVCAMCCACEEEEG